MTYRQGPDASGMALPSWQPIRRLALLAVSMFLGLVVLAGCESEDPRRPVRDSHAPLTLPTGFVEENLGGTWNQAVGLTFAEDGRFFVWEKGGVVWPVSKDGTKASAPLLDIHDEVGNWRDHGMLGMALHPNFLQNGYFYVLYVVDYHHLKNFGTPAYSPQVDEYFTDTIGRVVRYQARISDDFKSVVPNSRTVLLGETAGSGCPILDDTHGVGSLVFGTDGTLLVTCGDGGSANGVDVGGADTSTGIISTKENVGAYRSQLVDSLAGKVLRIDASTGDGVPSNPFYDPAAPRAARSRVWALGLRNPFRMSLRPDSGSHDPVDGNPGTIYLGDVGWDAYEELDVVSGPGKNLGWPLYEGLGLNLPYQQVANSVLNRDAPNPLYATTPSGNSACTEFFPFSQLLTQDTQSTPSFPNGCDTSQQVPSSLRRFVHSRPVMDWAHAGGQARVPTFDASGVASTSTYLNDFGGSCSVAGVWYTGTDFPPEYRNTYFHADYASGWIRNFVFDSQNQITSVRNFAPASQSPLVSLATSPVDGGLYYISYATTVSRIRYVGTANRPPVASASSNLRYGASPLTVQLSSDMSRDPELGPLTYSWDFGDGSAPSTEPNPTHVFDSGSSAPRAYTVTLTVKDVAGATGSTTLSIVVNDTPPGVVIASPTSGAVFDQQVQSSQTLMAALSDAEQPLESLQCTWQTILHHNSHSHPEPLTTGCVQTATIAPVPCDAEAYYYEFKVAVSDGVGLSTDASSFIYPDCAAVPYGPSNVITVTTPEYSWRSVLGADSYELVVDSGGVSGAIQATYTAAQLGCSAGVVTCAVTPSTALSTGAGTMKVRPHNPVSGWRAWSAAHSFFVDPSKATCSDGIKNQGEAGVDCGGPCPLACTNCGSVPLQRVAATASSVESAQTSADGAIDGSLSSRWASASSDPQWIAVDMGASVYVRRVVLSWETAASADYDIQVASSASGPWTTVYTQSNADGGTDDITGLGATGRYVRMYSRRRATQWGNSLYEFEVYGDTNPACGGTILCGNGTVNSGEQCDDGNTVDTDACSNACIAATCSDGVTNHGETAVDCGGPCAACPTCTDGIKNQGETGIDCGGPCVACPNSCNSNALPRVTAVASSSESSNGAGKAIDGASGTRWASLYSDPQWIYVDLGASSRVRRVVLTWEAAASADYDIQVASSTSGPWTTVYTQSNADGGTDDITGLDATGRYVRMYSRRRTTSWGNSLYEFEVYGDTNPACGGPVLCGNGTVDSGEQCDDGNTVDTDACSNACIAATCSDGVTNHGETAVDCGGPCAACPTCTDGIKNQGETGIDCGGPCVACPNSCNSNALPRVTAVASSSESSNGAGKAIDGASGTRWASLYSDPQWIYVDLGASSRVRRVVLTWEAAASADYDIQVASSTSGPWTTVYTQSNADGGTDDITGLDATGRYVRMYSRRRTTSWGNSLYEFEVYGDTNPACGGPVLCGNGTVDSGEQCDDGNTVDTDACSNACIAATCSDGVTNHGETAVDCGGPCAACPTCTDGIKNQGETGIDCGGPCVACPNSCNSNALPRVTAVASSSESSNGAGKAIDGASGTRWASLYSDPQWIYVDLGASSRVRRVVLTWEAAASADYDIQVASSTSGPWTTVYTQSNADGGTDDITGLDATGRYVRMYSRRRTTSWGNSLYEFEVYGDTNPACGGPVLCGNGTVDSGEQCDDGNTVDTDACSNACIAATCSDGVTNHGETAVDCGGPCAACPTCTDGIKNQGETGIDCGGPCVACPNSCNSNALPRVTAVASSSESSNPAGKAIDGASGTRWASQYSDPQWIYVDLGASSRVRRVVLTWEAAASADYDIQVASSTSGPWTTVYTQSNADGGTDDITGLDATGRYVRMYSRRRTTSWGNSLYEFVVYGDTNPACGGP